MNEIIAALDEARGHLGDLDDTREARQAKAAINRAALLLGKMGAERGE